MQNWLAQPDTEYSIKNEPPVQPKIKVTTLPVLGIWGAYDGALTEQPMLDTYNVVDDYTYRRFEISSHWPMLDEPKKFNMALVDFLKKNE